MRKKITNALLGLYSRLSINQPAIRGKITQLISPQEEDTSYLLHNSEYEQKVALEKTRAQFREQETEEFFNKPGLRFSDLLLKNPGARDLAVDIGCGAGWLSANLSRHFGKVIGIEPSAAAISMARQLHPARQYPNITWRVGFAEQEIAKISSEKPIAFFTSVVLSHLTDDAVAKICSSINGVAPRGSILGFGECWGAEHHRYMWHVRTKEWWGRNLPGWELDFFGPEVENVRGRHSGFHGVKAR